MTGTITRAVPYTGRAFAQAPSSAAGTARQAPAYASSAGRGGRAAMLLAEAIGRMAAQHQRTDVTPDMEPESPSLSSGEPGDFDESENDHVPEEEMEPFDPTIESALRATVTGDESEVTIIADEGETILGVTEEDTGDLEVLIEDTSDVLLADQAPKQRATVEGDEQQITITADPGEVLDASEMAGGDIVVHIDEGGA